MKPTQLFIDGTGRSILSVNYDQTLFLFHAYDGQGGTHCLPNDAGDAMFASEARQALETNIL